MNKLSELSIFFPAYNEEKNIEDVINETLAVADEIAEKYEIVIVNDASKDNTKAIVENIARTNPMVRCVSHPINRGYGGALKTGFESAKYNYVFFSDADRQFSIDQLKKFIPLADEADLVIGYRINRQDPFYRVMNAKAYNILIRILFRLPIRDIDCAFKLIKKRVLDSVEIDAESQFISAELLIQAHYKGFRIEQIGVDHLPRKQGKSTGNSIKAIKNSFKDLFDLYEKLKGIKHAGRVCEKRQ